MKTAIEILQEKVTEAAFHLNLEEVNVIVEAMEEYADQLTNRMPYITIDTEVQKNLLEETIRRNLLKELKITFDQIRSNKNIVIVDFTPDRSTDLTVDKIKRLDESMFTLRNHVTEAPPIIPKEKKQYKLPSRPTKKHKR